jgi:hypothetical protein
LVSLENSWSVAKLFHHFWTYYLKVIDRPSNFVTIK